VIHCLVVGTYIQCSGLTTNAELSRRGFLHNLENLAAPRKCQRSLTKVSQFVAVYEDGLVRGV
jgi:hypothetical protein